MALFYFGDFINFPSMAAMISMALKFAFGEAWDAWTIVWCLWFFSMPLGSGDMWRWFSIAIFVYQRVYSQNLKVVMFVYCFSRHFSRLEDTMKGLDLDVFIETPISVGSHVEVANAGCKLQRRKPLILPPKNGSPKRQIRETSGDVADECRWI